MFGKVKSFLVRWNRFWTIVGKFQLGIIFSIIYFTVIVPLVFIVKHIDPLGIKKPLYWRQVDKKSEMQQSRWQF